MGYITRQQPSGEEIKLYYEDLGSGQPVVFVHGWPSSGDMFEYQAAPLSEQGLRCITYDRRGFGKSSRPANGYDYDTLTDDLEAVMDGLNLQDVILVGFSMGGGEVARYFTRYSGARIAKVVLISTVLPYLMKTDDNPEGVDPSVFEEMKKNMQTDRINFLDNFGKQFFGVNMLNHPVSTPYLEYFRMLASVASPIATAKCAEAFAATDFRADVPKINVPALIIHGDDDKVVPIDSSSNRTKTMIPESKFIMYSGAPHGLFYTHREQLNADMLFFINGVQIPGATLY